MGALLDSSLSTAPVAASVVSNSVQPHRCQPTRLLCPWDSPGKNTGVGCHFLFQCMKVKSESEVAQLFPTLHDLMDCSLPGSSVHGIFQASIKEWVAISLLQLSAVITPWNTPSILNSFSQSGEVQGFFLSLLGLTCFQLETI